MLNKTKHDATSPKTVRQSVSFPLEIHKELEKIAEIKKVSVAWVVRDASEKYIAEQKLLLVNSPSAKKG